MELHIDIHTEHDGDKPTFWAEVRDLPGCFASGHTLAELIAGVEEAIEFTTTKHAR